MYGRQVRERITGLLGRDDCGCRVPGPGYRIVRREFAASGLLVVDGEAQVTDGAHDSVGAVGLGTVMGRNAYNDCKSGDGIRWIEASSVMQAQTGGDRIFRHSQVPAVLVHIHR